MGKRDVSQRYLFLAASHFSTISFGASSIGCMDEGGELRAK
jgi:hypothetical protein